MSEPIFPAAGGVAAPAPAEPQPEAKSNRKALIAVGGVVGALVVGAGAFFMLTSSGGGEDEFAMPVKKPVVAAVADPQASAPAKPTTVKVKVATVTSRDPFAVIFPAAATDTGTSTTGGSTTTTTDTTQTDTSTTSGGGTTAVPNQSTATSYAVGVTIIKQAEGIAQISVDGKKYSASVGKSFAPYFTLYAIFNSECVGLLFGDQNVPVCKGSPTTVSQ